MIDRAVPILSDPLDEWDGGPSHPRPKPRLAQMVRRGALADVLTVRVDGATLDRLSRQAAQMGAQSPADLVARMLDSLPAPETAGWLEGAGAVPSDRRQDDGRQGYAPYLVVTSRRARLAGILAWIRQQGDLAHVVPDLEQAAQHVHATRWSCIVVDVDSQGDLAAAVDAVVTLREQRPNLPVILVSAQVKRDDFELERLPLCDVTLRLPVDPENFCFAVQEAQVNNRVWIARRRALHLSRADGDAASHRAAR